MDKTEGVGFGLLYDFKFQKGAANTRIHFRVQSLRIEAPGLPAWSFFLARIRDLGVRSELQKGWMNPFHLILPDARG